jgi:ferrous iron transport protein B
MADLKIALVGNPNAGKTSLFNALTGSHQHVGNWPGKTVECKKGNIRYRGKNIEVTDLPGTYSLTALSEEEVIARDFILFEKPDIVVAVVDASNLERNLYLVVQVLELQVPLILVLNMSDRARSLDYEIEQCELSRRLGDIPVVLTNARRREGLEDLQDVLINLIDITQMSPAPKGLS